MLKHENIQNLQKIKKKREICQVATPYISEIHFCGDQFRNPPNSPF